MFVPKKNRGADFCARPPCPLCYEPETPEQRTARVRTNVARSLFEIEGIPEEFSVPLLQAENHWTDVRERWFAAHREAE